jgi:hypothetical protein
MTKLLVLIPVARISLGLGLGSFCLQSGLLLSTPSNRLLLSNLGGGLLLSNLGGGLSLRRLPASI